MLILGGTGFLGKHLSVMLHGLGYGDATVVSRNPDFDFIDRFAPSINAIRLTDLLSVLDDVKWDRRNIVYLAGNSIPGTFAETPWKEYSENVAPAFELLATIHGRYPAAKVVFISSGGTVYGKGHTSPIAETAPLVPISPYGLGKVAQEQAIEFLGRTSGLGFDILRVSNPVGRWQTNPSQGVVNVMARAIANEMPVTLLGDGGYVRDFVDADEVASAIIKVCRSASASNCAWNIGSGVGTSIAEVVTLIEQHFGHATLKRYLPARDLDVPYSVLDCRKASQELDWSARLSIDEMIARLVVSLR